MRLFLLFENLILETSNVNGTWPIGENLMHFELKKKVKFPVPFVKRGPKRGRDLLPWHEAIVISGRAISDQASTE